MFLKDDPGVGRDSGKKITRAIPRSVPLTPYSMSNQTVDPFDEGHLAAMRNAQQRALVSYQKSTSPSTASNPAAGTGGYMGSANALEHTLDLTRAAKEAAAAGKGDAASANPLQDLVDQGIMTDEEAQARAAKMFAPQLAYLDTLGSQAKGNAKASDKKLADLYAAVQAGYVADRPVVQAVYDKANKDTGTIYDQGVAANNQQQTDMAARTALMFQKLGLPVNQQALAAQMGDASATNQRLTSAKAAEQAGTVGQRTAAMNDLTVKGQAAGLVGADQRSALQMKLMDILGGYGMKKAELQGQQASAAQDILSKSSQSQSDAMKALMDQQQQAFDNDYKMKQLQLQQQKAGATGAPKLSPIEEISAAASDAYQKFGQQTYGHAVGPEEAANGVKAITDAASTYLANKGQNPTSAQDFMDWVRQTNPKAKDINILRDLAQRYFKAAWG